MVAMIRRTFFTLTLLVLYGRSQAERSLNDNSEAQRYYEARRLEQSSLNARRLAQSSLNARRLAQSSLNDNSEAERYYEARRLAQSSLNARRLAQSSLNDNSEAERYYEARRLALSSLNAPRQAQSSFNGQMCPTLTGCSLNCPNGRVRDSNGCETCRCRVCGPDPCAGLICLYGKARDSDGCLLCDCNQPCSGLNCPVGQECQVVKGTTANTYRGQCVQRATTMAPSCQPITCSNTCPYGFQSNDRGCRTCNCWCETRSCGVNERCVKDPCVDANNCRDFGYYCVPNDQRARVASEVLFESPPAPTAGSLQAAMRQCCSDVTLSSSCLKNCVTITARLFSQQRNCLPETIEAYMRCVSGVLAKSTKTNPWIIDLSLPTIDRKKRAAKQKTPKPSARKTTKTPVKTTTKRKTTRMPVKTTTTKRRTTKMPVKTTTTKKTTSKTTKMPVKTTTTKKSKTTKMPVKTTTTKMTTSKTTKVPIKTQTVKPTVSKTTTTTTTTETPETISTTEIDMGTETNMPETISTTESDMGTAIATEAPTTESGIDTVTTTTPDRSGTDNDSVDYAYSDASRFSEREASDLFKRSVNDKVIAVREQNIE